MPKAEKESKKELTVLHQEIKRRNKTSPGTPQDIGFWEGASNTRYRWLSHLCPQFALEFLASSVLQSPPQFAFSFLNSLSINVELIKLSPLMLEARTLAGVFSCIVSFLRTFSSTVNFNGVCLKITSKTENESLTCVDEVNTELV